MVTTYTGSGHFLGRVFQGWWVVAGVFVAEMFAIGSTSYAFSLFVVPAGDEFGLSRAATNTGLVLILLGMAISAPIIGRLLDRLPARFILVGGAIGLGAGLIGIGLANSIWVIAALLLLLVGPGAGATGPLSAATVVSRWFSHRRGRALGVAAVATSMGGTLIVPMVGFNLSLFGWRGALLIQGGLVVVLVSLVAALLVRDSPSESNDEDRMYGTEDVSQAKSAPDVYWSPARILRNRNFWCIGLAVGLTFAVTQAVLVSLVPYALDMGLDVAQASMFIAIISFASILGKLCFGTIADRVDKRRLLLVIMAVSLLQLACLWAQPEILILVLVLAVSGFTAGGELPVWQALVADRFGRISYGTALGFMQFILTVCSIFTIIYVGGAYDEGGSYGLGFVTLMAVVLLAMVFVLLITPAAQNAVSPRMIPAASVSSQTK